MVIDLPFTRHEPQKKSEWKAKIVNACVKALPTTKPKENALTQTPQKVKSQAHGSPTDSPFPSYKARKKGMGPLLFLVPAPDMGIPDTNIYLYRIAYLSMNTIQSPFSIHSFVVPLPYTLRCHLIRTCLLELQPLLTISKEEFPDTAPLLGTYLC